VQEELLRAWLGEKLGPLQHSLTSLKSELNDNWLACFEEEQHALEAFSLLREQSFQEKQILVEVKSDTLLRSVSVTVNPEKVDSKLESIMQPKVISIDELRRDHL